MRQGCPKEMSRWASILDILSSNNGFSYFLLEKETSWFENYPKLKRFLKGDSQLYREIIS